MARRANQVCSILIVALLAEAYGGGGAVVLAQGGTGQIEGVARDEQGRVVPGATLTLQNQASGVVRTTVTDADGKYRFPALSPGIYILKAELQGFAAQEV